MQLSHRPTGIDPKQRNREKRPEIAVILGLHPPKCFFTPLGKIAEAKSNCIIQCVASQKKYVTDHITKKEVINHGQKPRYYSVGTHPAIVASDVFKGVQQLIEANRVKDNIKGKPTAKYPFTGKIECSYCGKYFARIIRTGIAKWQCATYLNEGREACPAKQIPEDTLLVLACKVLGMDKFDLDVFDNRVLKMMIVAPGMVRFVLRDGHEIDITWENRSRRDSWTEEMKQLARERKMRKGT